jgi:GNAT superfamily N-acetyltransferase
MTLKLQIKPLLAEHLATPFTWAQEEGWNPGTHDLIPFTQVDPMGFIGGYLNDELVATISAVRYNQHFGFVGFYIVAPKHRGHGYGIQVWNAGIAHLEDLPCVGLDGVLAQTDNYQKSGFQFAHKNCRFEGYPQQFQANTGGELAQGERLKPLAEVGHETLASFDERYFPTRRETFLKAWVTQADHHGLVIMRGHDICAYGIIRPCHLGHKIGPLFAQTISQARSLLLALCSGLDPKTPVYLDPPATNLMAINLAQSLGMTMVFETARMYKGATPTLPIEHIYGMTSFELG